MKLHRIFLHKSFIFLLKTLNILLLLHNFFEHGPGPHFTNVFSIAIQIWWKFHFTLTSILIQWSLQNFVHGTTSVLSWHVQKFVGIWWPAKKLQQGEFSVEFELQTKNLQWNRPQVSSTVCDIVVIPVVTYCNISSRPRSLKTFWVLT